MGPSMSSPLPVGWTCGDCIHLKKTCAWLVGATPEWTECDWSPPRFVERQSETFYPRLSPMPRLPSERGDG
jgi:hypothetical protein